ncbi:hypothetical protein BDF20DRAFT_819705 [Mycotypha africana]|uniref:uncharacterized protein n=1 Tax=Mycotypha africana TaxID=64632 RepID=UPI0023000334|nr:uncharacterized protein BDF20DRAFT_819705 [Mycotypha africana]KAI8979818.1 hypothetical protein BDF20DRAFT_819705 [Mycotypha africana]
MKKTTPANLSVDDAIYNSTKASSFLLHMLVMTEPHQIKANEIVKDAYEECLQLKEYLSEYLWTESDSEGINTIQASLDELNKALDKYEMTNDIVEGEW